MELKDLIAAVKAAKTKNELADLVSDELSLDLNKNKTMKALRAEVLNGLGVTEDDSAEEDKPEEDKPEELIDLAAEGADQAITAAAEEADQAVTPTIEKMDSGAVIVTQPLTVPAADEAPAPAPKPSTENRLLRNTKSGRTFIWTPVLAKLPGMTEV